MNLRPPRELIATVRASAAAMTVTGARVNVLAIETSANVGDIQLGQIYRVKLQRVAIRKPALRKNRIRD
jgi:hypothetical protein